MDSLGALLRQLDPDIHYAQWIRVLMAVFHETGGHECGFRLVDAWSSHGSKYKGEQDVRTYWRNLKSDLEKPLTIGTLKWMVKQQDLRRC
jgi:hypothetical protein